LGDSPTTDIDEFQQRVKARRAKWLEDVDFTDTPEEAERKKREAIETPIQEGSEDDVMPEGSKETEGEDYPYKEGKRTTPRAPKDKSNPNPSPLNETD